MRLRANLLSGAILALAVSGTLLANAMPVQWVPAMPDSPYSPPAHTQSPEAAAPSASPSPASGYVEGAHGIRVELAPPPLPVYAPNPAGPGYLAAPPLTFRCPSVTTDPFGAVKSSTGDRTDVTGCPFRVYDDTFSFGNPQIAVNPIDATQAVFTSLHSPPDASGPTPRSRDPNEPQTAFTSYNQGISWFDQPIGGSTGNARYGESSSTVMDTKGNIYIAYLWSSPGTNDTYGSSIGLFKAGTSKDLGSVSDSYSDPTTIEGRTPTNPIPRVGLVYVPPYVPPADLNTTGNLTGGPATKGEIGQEAQGGVNKTEERVAAVWFERATAEPWGPGGYPGWIDAAFTDTGSKNNWARLDEGKLIGPCLDASNAVAWAGQVYVACVVDKGYDARSRARIGDIDIWALDPLTGNTTLVGATPLVGGHPLLAATPDGYFVLATTRLVDKDGASVNVAAGWYGRTWTPMGDVGPNLHAMAGAKPVYDAAVTALSVSSRYKVFALSYMEWQKPTDPTAAPAPPPPPDPGNPLGSRPRLTDYRKFLLVGKECDNFPLGAAEMQLGTGVDGTNLAAYTQRPSVFDDNQDGLVDYVEADGSDVWYFAINDYGAMQYGAVVTAATGSSCPIAPAPLPPPPVPVPQALSLASPANIMLGSSVGVAAGAMLLYLLTVKRRAAAAAVAEDK